MTRAKWPATKGDLSVTPNVEKIGSCSRAADGPPHLGLVCITVGPEVRYRTITRTRFLAMSEADQQTKLQELYRDNIQTLFKAIDFCRDNGIRLYRATSALFPQVDHAVGKRTLESLRDVMAGFGAYAERHGVRVLLHPDQYVVLNSDFEAVRAMSLSIMADHALAFDMLGLPRSTWSCMILHGGKGGRVDALVEVVQRLPEAIRSRLVLENDESAYGAAEILDICRRTNVPMVFDAHHHVIREKLDSYEHESVRRFTEQARDTWPTADWQLVHISNGHASFGDSKHSEIVTVMPSAFADVPWIEVEAKGKENAIAALRGLPPAHSEAVAPAPPAARRLKATAPKNPKRKRVESKTMRPTKRRSNEPRP